MSEFFPILSEYVVDSTGKKTLVSNPGLWDFHFSEVDFNKKLSSFNEKIGKYRGIIEHGGSRKDAYMAVLTFKYQAALTKYYNKAGEFADFMKLGSILNPKDPNYLKLSVFGNYRHLYLTRLLYKITIPLTSF